MHPILGQIRRLALYLLAWLPITALVYYLVTAKAGLGKGEAAVLVVPLCLLYAFICLSAWYSCRGIPVDRSGVFGVVLPHLLAALIVSYFWVLLARALARALATFSAFSGLDERLARYLPLLLGIGVLLYLLAVSLFYVMLAQTASREAEQREMQARVLARDAELRALKAQVNPHFLFNSLHSISALTSNDPARAREMCIALADFLRRTLGLGEKAVIPLEEELSLIRSFMAVEKIRFGDRLLMEEAIEHQTLDCMVPPLLLQPLVENAVAHGIANLTEGGWIRLDTKYTADESVAITVENSFDPEAPTRRRNGVGLANVRQRLSTRYGDRASFSVSKQADRFHVGIILPAERAVAGV